MMRNAGNQIGGFFPTDAGRRIAVQNMKCGAQLYQRPQALGLANKFAIQNVIVAMPIEPFVARHCHGDLAGRCDARAVCAARIFKCLNLGLGLGDPQSPTQRFFHPSDRDIKQAFDEEFFVVDDADIRVRPDTFRLPKGWS